MSDNIPLRKEHFTKFHNLLMKEAPKGYLPWYIPVTKEGKAVDGRVIYKRADPYKSCCGTEWKTITLNNGSKKTICKKCGRTRGSWKQTWARHSFQSAIKLIEQGYNIGLAARKDDLLVIIDIDNFTKAHLLPITLKNKSRKRCGYHGFYFREGKEIPNIPTDDNGEVRSIDQYVVVSGFIQTSKEEIEKEVKEGHIKESHKEEILKDENLGFYTVDTEVKTNKITYDELPDFFKEEYEKQEIENIPKSKNKPIKFNGVHSALFDLTIKDIIEILPDSRVHHPLHASDTSSNFSVSSDYPDLCNCWRHSVSLNALQFLAVKSGYISCCEAGTGHSGKNPSKIIGDKGAIFHAWLQAKKDKIIPMDDPLPRGAMKYIAVKHGLLDSSQMYKALTYNTYIRVIKIVESEY